MLSPKIVLAPVDFSDPARDAVATAADIASRYGASLILVHVVPALPSLPAGVSIFKEREYEKALHEEAVSRLAEISAECTRGGVAVQSHVGTANDVGMELLRVAESHKADLIVISTHGMTGWNARIFGSVAEKVVRLAQSAVMVLRASPTTVR